MKALLDEDIPGISEDGMTTQPSRKPAGRNGMSDNAAPTRPAA